MITLICNAPECRKSFNTTYSCRSYCSRSCAATSRNKKRRRQPKLCIVCSNSLPRHQRQYCSNTCQQQLGLMKRFESWSAGAQLSRVSPGLKKLLFESQGSKCAICCLPPIWNDKPLVMVLDHIDGNAFNNSISNVRVVCPNCNAQLPTFTGRNRGNGRHDRRMRYRQGLSY